jgi:hypothetical protein
VEEWDEMQSDFECDLSKERAEQGDSEGIEQFKVFGLV